MTVAFELEGQAFTALNGGPVSTFNEAISFQVSCETQEELDYYWEKLSEGGDAQAQQCGWLKDRYGVSWQVVPTVLPELLQDADAETSQRVMKAMLHMKKMDIETLKPTFRTAPDIFMNKMLRKSARVAAAVAGAGHADSARRLPAQGHAADG